MADVYVPTSPDGMVLAKLRRMAALSLTFRTLVATQLGLSVTTNAEAVYQAAFARVFYEYVPLAAEHIDDGVAGAVDIAMPFSSLWLMPMQNQVICGGSQYHMRPRGSVYMTLYVEPNASQLTWNDKRLAGVDFLGNWLKDISDLSAADDTASIGTPAVSGEGHLAITIADAQVTDQVPFKVRKSAGSFFWRHVVITFGDG
jgi:hypothetical protein